MEKLLVNVSLFFQRLLSSRCSVFWLLLWTAAWCSLSVFENSPEKSCIFALERLLFIWKNVVCIVDVPSLLPTESAKEVSLEKQCAFLLSVPLGFLLHNISSNHSLNTEAFSLQMFGHFTVLIKKIKLHWHIFWPIWESVHLLTARDLPECEQVKLQWPGVWGLDLHVLAADHYKLLESSCAWRSIERRMFYLHLFPAVCWLAATECQCFA